jgi:hypothetical protein
MHRLTLWWVLTFLASNMLLAQSDGFSGRFVLECRPSSPQGYFPSEGLEVWVDGPQRVKIVERSVEDSLVTYLLGTSVVKEFRWFGERIALASERPMPVFTSPVRGPDGTPHPPMPFRRWERKGLFHVETVAPSSPPQPSFSPSTPAVLGHAGICITCGRCLQTCL